MSAATSLVVAALGAALLLIVAAWLTSGAARSALTTTIGDASWNVSRSWASNVTVVGAILGTVLSARILPTPTTVVGSPNGYTTLSLLFGALVVVAPLAFTALRIGTPDPKGPEYTGRGWAFLLASCLTLWAVIGELATVGLVLYEAQHGKTVALGAVIPIWVVLGSAIVLVSVYGFTTVQLILGPAAKNFQIQSHQAPTTATSGWTLL